VSDEPRAGVEEEEEGSLPLFARASRAKKGDPFYAACKGDGIGQ
jgi:hypothetical protein